MGVRRSMFVPLALLVLIAPLAASSISVEPSPHGGFDANGDWAPSVESDIHWSWWTHWSRDKDSNSLDDRLEWLIEQPEQTQRDWWKRAPQGSARIFVDYDHHPTDADVSALESLGVVVTFRYGYLDTISGTSPISQIVDEGGIRSLNGVVMVEDLGLAETNMHEAVPNMGVDTVWQDLGIDGTGSVIAILDTGVRGDHEGLNDMDDDPLTCIDDPPDPFDPDPDPLPSDCDPKIIAFFDAVFTDAEQDPSTSYDSGTHGSHVAGIAAGTGGGQADPGTGLRYVGAAPGAHLINILGCCDGDIEDVMQGAQWAIDNKEKYGIDIVTSSLGEQQFELHLDNDGNSAWSRQMDMVVEAGIITTLSAGNEFGGLTVAGCNTIDSPGDARLPVTVASLDKDLKLAIYSSRGYTSDLRVKPDVATIGSNIMAPDAATSDGYTSKSGTSMATPLMAGIAALMVEANPDLTPTEFKEIISAHSIERDLQLLDDPGFNDCSILETRPDNEFGYGQADPLAFVEAAGSIDRSLNVSMDVETLQQIGNESFITGTASGVPPGTGIVEVRVGGGEWKGAADLSGDWSNWRVKLDPHVESGNSTIYARLVFSDDSISPIDSRRVILIDEQSSGALDGDLTTLNSMVFIVPFTLVSTLLVFVAIRERWDRKFKREGDEALLSQISTFLYYIHRTFWLEWRLLPSLVIGAPRLVLDFLQYSREAWNDGESLVENQFRRYISLSILYTAQGLPAGFTAVVFPAYLYVSGYGPAEVATMWAVIALPWTFKFLYGPIVDSVQAPSYGLRRPWILFAQTGMVITLGVLLFIPNLAASIETVTLILFVHNLFSSLQDVSVDALAVDILQPDEVAKANGFMFAAKRVGIIASGAGLGSLVAEFGIKSAILIQLPMLLIIMALPLFLRERPGDRLFPWGKYDSNGTPLVSEEESGEIEVTAPPWQEDDGKFSTAKWVADNLRSKNISVPATVLWTSIITLLISMALWVMGEVGQSDSLIGSSKSFYKGGKIGLLLFALLLLLGKWGLSLPHIPNMFSVLLPWYLRSNTSKSLSDDGELPNLDFMRGPAETAYNIVKGFSLKSSFLLIFLCLLTELYVFVDPIMGDVFINRAGWTSTEYVKLMGGWVVVFTIVGQLLGGFLGDKYGIREVAMVGWILAAITNSGLAMIEPWWSNTTLMTAYLCLRAFIFGIAWISVISICMRLTYSKAGGTQFTAYMSMFNLSGVITLLMTGELLLYIDYVSALYLGGALTLVTVVLLVFIDPEECDRVLEKKSTDVGVMDAEIMDVDLGESVWWEEEGGGDSVTAA